AALSVDLGDKRLRAGAVGIARYNVPAREGLKCINCREVDRPSVSCHIDVAGRVHSDATGGPFLTAAAEVGRVDQRRVDNQRLALVVAEDVKANVVVGGQDVAAVQQFSIL